MGTSSGSRLAASRRLPAASYANETSFKPGNPGGPGRPRGSKNRIQVDLAQEIVAAAADIGFLKRDEKGEPIVTGTGGLSGYLRYAAVYETKTYLGLLARCLPYFIVDGSLDRPVMTREEAIAKLRERGLPVELLEVLRKAPVRLDDDEDPDPYGRKTINAKP
jgi:hypothetical protein